jgi:hypothetical protein
MPSQAALPAQVAHPVQPGPLTLPALAVVPRSRLALQAEPAFGVSGPFFTQLVGLRCDWLFSRSWAAGPYLGYANLKGPHGQRVHNVLLYVQVEYRESLSEAIALSFKFSPGYLPRNGPYLRTSAGLSLDVGGGARLGLDPLVPSFWLVDDRAELSLGLAFEVSQGF